MADHPDEIEFECFTHGRIVQSSDAERPYKVILSRDRSGETERLFATMRDAEAFIRRNTPRPRSGSTAWDNRRA